MTTPSQSPSGGQAVAPIYRIADKAPEFPCWLYFNRGVGSYWARYAFNKNGWEWYANYQCTHWCADGDVKPPHPVAPEAAVRAEFLHRNHAPKDWVILTLDEVRQMHEEAKSLRADLAAAQAELKDVTEHKDDWMGRHASIFAENEQLKRELATQSAEVEAVKRQVQRFDWLKTAFHRTSKIRPSIHLKDGHCVIWDQSNGLTKISEGETMEAAIDAARAAHP